MRSGEICAVLLFWQQDKQEAKLRDDLSGVVNPKRRMKKSILSPEQGTVVMFFCNSIFG